MVALPYFSELALALKRVLMKQKNEAKQHLTPETILVGSIL